MKAYVFVVLALVAGAPAQAAEPLTYDRVPVRVGQTWTYGTALGNTVVYKVTAVDADGGYAMNVTSSATGRTSVRTYDADGNVLSVNGHRYLSEDGRPWKKDVYHLPLVSGQKYATVACVQPHPRTEGVTITGTPEIVSIEEAPVAVPQGSYDRAIRVEVRFRYRLSTGYGNYVSETYWLVPGMARPVKMWERDWGRSSSEGTTLELTGVSG